MPGRWPEAGPGAGPRAGASLVFMAGGHRHALPAALVREILPMPALVPVPQTPPALLGLANVRGEILSVIGLAGLAEDAAPPATGSGAALRIVVTSASMSAPASLSASVSASAPVSASGSASASASPPVPVPVPIPVSEPVALAVDRVIGLQGDADLPWLNVAALIGGQLRRPVMHAAARKTAGVDRPAPAPAEAPLVLLQMVVNGQDCALPVADVRAVLSSPDAAADTILLRGRAVPVLSLARLLGLPDQGGGKLLVVDIDGVPCALRVQKLKAVLRALPGQIDAAPPILARGTEEMAEILGIVRAGDDLVSILSAARLLRDPVQRARLHAAAGGPGAPDSDAAVRQKGPEAGPGEDFLLFAVAGDVYAVPVSAVAEVIHPPELARVPAVPEFVLGIADIRGESVPVLDQRRRFGLPRVDPAEAARQRVIVLRGPGYLAGWQVDRALGVRRIAGEMILAASDRARKDTGGAIRGAANLPDRPVLILAADALLGDVGRAMLAATHPAGLRRA